MPKTIGLSKNPFKNMIKCNHCKVKIGFDDEEVKKREYKTPLGIKKEQKEIRCPNCKNDIKL